MSFETKVNYTSTLEWYIYIKRTFGRRNNRQKAKMVVEIQLFDLFLLHPPSLHCPIWTFRTIFQLVPSSKSSSRSRNDRSSFFFQMIEHNTDTIFDRFSKESHNYAATNFQIYTIYFLSLSESSYPIGTRANLAYASGNMPYPVSSLAHKSSAMKTETISSLRSASYETCICILPVTCFSFAICS